MRARSLVMVAGVFACTAALTLSATAQTTAPVQVDATGAVAPPKGSGMGTKAALENPNCDAEAVDGWGSIPQVTENAGPYCVVPAPKDNGGATARGVTADSIKVVVVLANDQQVATAKQQGGQPPRNQATGAEGTIKDAFLDSWTALEHTYESWGRKADFTFITSSGDDEASQRADAIKVEQVKPMFVVDTTSNGLGTLAAVLGKDKYTIYSYATTHDESLSQAPYRWGQADATAAALNTSEFVTKQLAKHKAEFAGDDAMHSTTRTFAVIAPKAVDVDSFVASLKKAGVTLSTPPITYTTNGSPLGDPAQAQIEAPTIIGKLKAEGITSPIMFTDIAMTGAMTKIATQQQYSPEWIMTGYQYQDITLLARPSYDQDQWAHAFGISGLWPLVESANVNTSLIAWYWGTTQGTVDIVTQTRATWLAAAIHYAGPTLTPQNVKKGLFSVPARGGAASDSPVSAVSGYGKTAGLTYDSYYNAGKDYAPVWYDAKTTGNSQIYPTVGQGVLWYVNGGQRYTAGSWPKQPIKFFDKSGAVISFATSPVPVSPAAACTGCPSSGGAGTPAAGQS